MSWFERLFLLQRLYGELPEGIPEHLAQRIHYSKKEARIMKTTLFSLVVAVLGAPLLMHAVNPPTDGFCSNASVTAKTVINFLLALTGRGPIC
jgi:hypothetical protein